MQGHAGHGQGGDEGPSSEGLKAETGWSKRRPGAGFAGRLSMGQGLGHNRAGDTSVNAHTRTPHGGPCTACPSLQG